MIAFIVAATAKLSGTFIANDEESDISLAPFKDKFNGYRDEYEKHDANHHEQNGDGDVS